MQVQCLWHPKNGVHRRPFPAPRPHPLPAEATEPAWTATWNHARFTPAAPPFFERYDENFHGRTGLGGLELWIPIKM